MRNREIALLENVSTIIFTFYNIKRGFSFNKQTSVSQQDTPNVVQKL